MALLCPLLPQEQVVLRALPGRDRPSADGCAGEAAEVGLLVLQQASAPVPRVVGGEVEEGEGCEEVEAEDGAGG